MYSCLRPEATDDVEIAVAIGIDVKVVESTSPNIKITTASDLLIARRLVTCEH